jgi:Resolvase, N terminal domain
MGKRHDGPLVGYARTSTIEQQAGLEAQQRDLRTTGCRKIFSEQTSSVGARAQLEAALDYCREVTRWSSQNLTGSRGRRGTYRSWWTSLKRRAWRSASLTLAETK